MMIVSLPAVVFFAAGCRSSGSRGANVILDAVPNTQKITESLLAGSAGQATAGHMQVQRLAAAIVASPGKIGLPGLGSPNRQFALHVFAMRGLNSNDVRRVSLPSLSIDGRMPAGGAAPIRKLLNPATDSSLNVDLAKSYTDQFLEANP